jgi:polyphosphate glucokinase
MQVLGIDIGGSATKGAIVDTETGLLVSERVRIAYKTIQEPTVIVKSINKIKKELNYEGPIGACLLYTSPSPRDRTRSRMPSSA